jgi:aminoglycoside phosphotransferase (APT) family kinase protein
MDQAARDLAQFITVLQQINATGGPSPGSHNSFCGEPLALRDAETRRAITNLNGMINTARATAACKAALQAPTWDGLPVWIHGDLSPLNLLVKEGRLSAVIDFGCLGTGDPACDLQVAWNLLSPQ